MTSRQPQTALPQLARMKYTTATAKTFEKRRAFPAAYQFYIEHEEPLE